MANKEDMKTGLDALLTGSAKKAARKETVPTREQLESAQNAHRKANAGRPRKDDTRERLSATRKTTTLSIEKGLYSKIGEIALLNGLNISEVVNGALRNYIKLYEKKHGEITPRESNISADSLI